MMRVTDDKLLALFADWLAEQGVSEPDDRVGTADLFLNWCDGYRGGSPEMLDEGDIDDFLLGWCPEKLTMPPEESAALCRGLGEFIEFLGESGTLRCDDVRRTELAAHAVGSADIMQTRMADPANWGMAKSLFSGIDGAASMTEQQLGAALQQRMEEHNALPFEERWAATDEFFESPEPEPSILCIPPAEADVAVDVAAAVLPDRVHKLRDYLGDDGKALTDKGNLKLVDGRALVELLDTGDTIDPTYGDRTFRTRSTADLPQLAFLLAVAEHAGAVRRHRKRLVPVKAWTQRSALDAATRLFAAVIEIGVLSGRENPYYGVLHRFLDDGVVYWLAGGLSPGASIGYDEIVELNAEAVLSEFEGEFLENFVSGTSLQRDITRILEALVLAGAITWTGRRQYDGDVYLDPFFVGGTITLTSFGRAVLPEHLARAGIAVSTVADLADLDLVELRDALRDVPAETHAAMLMAWRPELTMAERAALVAAMVAEADDAVTRLDGIHLLGMFDDDVTEPHMRQLLDTEAAGHAAIWLLDRGLAEPEAVGGFITPAVLIDILSLTVDDPAILSQLFLSAPEPEEMLEFFWRHPASETAAVLDALGRHLSDPRLAKLARKAAIKHRSWIANQGRS